MEHPILIISMVEDVKGRGGSSISEGMAQEIQWAKRRHMPIRYFTEEMEEVV